MNIAVIGAGAWGTAFSLQLANRGHRILLWVYEQDLCRVMEDTGENLYYLPGFRLSDNIAFTNDLRGAVASSDDIVVATPSFALRRTLSQVSDALGGKRILVLTKGLETETLLRMSQVVEEVSGGSTSSAVLSGPSFAKELAGQLFTSVVIASRDKSLARYFQEMSHDERLRVYTSNDVIGVEIGGALKNVMAIGAGIIEGLGLGHNTLAAYITRALAEIKRLGSGLGARETTFMGLSGMGDLILTCTGPLSRNRTFGMELTKGRSPRKVIESQKVVVEGFYTIDAAYRFSRTLGIEMPITEELYRVVYEGKDIKASFDDIRKRDTKEEDG
ncbi:MAG: Glycerol-3-phosphate dehydrogenase (NAD(P)+) [Syntrophorhabdaceae bacterium PtaU1.Bin034]|jgi:glycerol-3-phosphate dehydrogenase (NAD(P)+)|nr:MAG: Glycerol-3-phosphate dehydrogenase (NAD(P)+) [Syntrophorhabdaceae bacterium PtaU1.Bin034]